MVEALGRAIPDRRAVELLLPLFERALFPRVAGQEPEVPLRRQLTRILAAMQEFGKFDIESVITNLLQALAAIRADLLLDAEQCLEGDPSATSIAEVILAYPGFRAIMIYRVAHALLRLGVPLLPRMLCACIHSKTGIDIHPGAQIAAPFSIDHGTGVVIGETAIVGKNVVIYQGVTLGALAVKKADAGVKRHPTIGDNVIIYANSTILGGNTEIGHDSVIGGNTWLTKGVPPYSIVFTEHKTVVRDRESFVQAIDFNI